MRTADLAARLDSFFHLDRYPADDFAEIEQFSREAGIALESFARAEFMRRHNGLMLHNGDSVEAMFTLVFPSDKVISEAVRRAAGRPALVFTHHPMDFETSGRGLIPISTRSLERLREAGVSLYSAHAPLDCQETVSTSRALARAVGVPGEHMFAGYHGGHAGVWGSIDPLPLDDFISRLRLALGIERIDAKRHADTVRTVAVVAGGAAFPALMQEALDAGCDTYLTGDYRVRHGGEWAEQHRPEFDAFVERVPLNLIGASHYASEALVLQQDMLTWFHNLGLDAEFVPQEDPWR